MSINSAMLAGVSGLVANSSALAAISDNIANVNTTAYKRNQVNFSDMVTSQSVQGRYSAGGVQGVTRQFVSAQGQIQSATATTDLAINGDGFFIVTAKGQGVTPTDPRLYTRSGSFQPDADGFLVNDGGMYLQGWPVQPDGTYDTSPSDLNKLTSINVKDLATAVEPTTAASINANLDNSTAVSAAVSGGTYDPASATTSMAAYAAGVTTGTKPDAPPIEINVIDSQGTSHTVAISFLKTANPNEWKAEIYAVPASDVTAAAGAPAGQIASGIVKFNSDGSIDTSSATTLPTTISLGASTATTGAHWAAGLGVDANSVSLDLSKLGQRAEASTVTSAPSNGAAVGNIIGVTVGQDGVVSAVFDNNQVRAIAKVPVATFPNDNGLQASSGSAYQATLASGQMTIKAPGDGGAGDIAPSSLEASTVDLSSEFTGLISTQKAYSASSKIITTADEMLDELINIIR
jgi:flagellar hook protein FlgE